MQKRVALSTSAAEATAMYYTAVSQAEVNVLSFRDILKEILCEQRLPTYMFCDNKGAVEATHNPMTGKMRHINMKIHHLRESIEAGRDTDSTYQDGRHARGLLHQASATTTPRVSQTPEYRIRNFDRLGEKRLEAGCAEQPTEAPEERFRRVRRGGVRLLKTSLSRIAGAH